MHARFYVFDQHRKLAYRGRLDNSRPNSGIPLTGEDLRKALDAVLAEESVFESNTQVPDAILNGSDLLCVESAIRILCI